MKAIDAYIQVMDSGNEAGIVTKDQVLERIGKISKRCIKPIARPNLPRFGLSLSSDGHLS